MAIKRSHILAEILIKHLKQIEVIYYQEDKTADFRAAKMRAEAQSAIDAYDNFQPMEQS
jgi:hypothetical protein